MLARSLVGGGRRRRFTSGGRQSRPEPPEAEEPRLPIFTPIRRGQAAAEEDRVRHRRRAKDEAKPVKFDADRAVKYLEATLRHRPAHQRHRGDEEAAGAHREALQGSRRQGHAAGVQGPPGSSRKARPTMANLIVSWHPDRSAASSSARTTTPGRSPTRRPNRAQLEQAVRQRQRRRPRRRLAHGTGPPHEGPRRRGRRRFRPLRRRGVRLRDDASAAATSTSSAPSTSPSEYAKIEGQAEAPLRRRRCCSTCSPARARS